MNISNDQLTAQAMSGSGGGTWPEKKTNISEQSVATETETAVLESDTVQISQEALSLNSGSGGGTWPDKKVK